MAPERAGGAVYLLTDYGLADEFAGVTRAVVLREAPGAPVVDLTHGIPPFAVRAGALTLARSVVHLGPGVVVAVVDPGVGGGRRGVALAVAADGGPRYLVGPDNGLLCWAAERLGGAAAAVALPPGPGPGHSFDGRDVFAPAAAALWSGRPLAALGHAVDPGSLVRLAPLWLAVTPPEPGRPGSLHAEVTWVDRFGNVQLAARQADGEEAALAGSVEIATATVSVEARTVDSFDALGDDETGLMVDANGHLALVCRRRSAATVLGVAAGETVQVRQRGGGRP